MDLRQIGYLYRIEENLRRSKAGPNKRAAERMSQSRLNRRLSRVSNGDIGFMTLRRLRPLPSNSGSEADPGPGSSRARESEGLLAALRGSLRSPRVPRSMCG
jgi:hypothetical protein